MPLSVDAIAALSRLVALEHGRALSVVGVTATDGGSHRAEVLIAVGGCHDGECRLLLNIDRAEPSGCEVELRRELTAELRRHRAG